jgi:transposase
MEVVILEGKKKTWHSLKTDAQGRATLCGLLRTTDVVGMEMCCCSVMLTREILRDVGCTVYDLNAGELQIIWKSRKKTDREDSLKIAKYIRDTPEEEMQVVALPTEAEELFRADITMKAFLQKERTAAINRLHSLYAREGLIDVKKKDLATKERRLTRRRDLSAGFQKYAAVLEEQLDIFEQELAAITEVVNEKTRDKELAPYVLSIPGVGLSLASVLLAYLGDGSRFTRASQVANYAGLTPRVDCSGETNHYGSIPRFTCCRPIRAMILEGVWALARSSHGGKLLEKFQQLSARMNKKKSAVAIGRKMVVLAWLLMKRREFYQGMPDDVLRKKLSFYKIKPEKWEALLDKKTT